MMYMYVHLLIHVPPTCIHKTRSTTSTLEVQCIVYTCTCTCTCCLGLALMLENWLTGVTCTNTRWQLAIGIILKQERANTCTYNLYSVHVHKHVHVIVCIHAHVCTCTCTNNTPHKWCWMHCTIKSTWHFIIHG